MTKTVATFEVTPVGAEERLPWLREHAGGGPHRLVLARDEGDQVVGWATTSSFRPRAAYATTVESSVYCRPGYEGRGVGSRLYGFLFASIESEDIERIVAGVALPNPASLALHARFGFRPVGTFTRVGRKFGRYWDVTWLERPLRSESPRKASAQTAPFERRITPVAPSGTASNPAEPQTGR